MASNRPFSYIVARGEPPPKKTGFLRRDDGVCGSRRDTLGPPGFNDGRPIVVDQGTASETPDEESLQRDWESAKSKVQPIYENLEKIEKSNRGMARSSQQLPDVAYNLSQQFLFLNDHDDPEVMAYDMFRRPEVGHDVRQRPDVTYDASQQPDVTYSNCMSGCSTNGSWKEADDRSSTQRTGLPLPSRIEDLYGVVNRQQGPLGGPGSKNSDASSIDRTAPPQLHHPLSSSTSSTTADHTDVATSSPSRGVYESAVDLGPSVRPTPAELSNWGSTDYDFTSSPVEQPGIFNNFILVGPSKNDKKTMEAIVPVQTSTAPAFNHEPRLPVKLLQLFEPPEPRTFSLLGVTNTESSDFNLSASRLKPATPQQQICLEKDKVMKVKGAGIARGFENHHFNNHLNLSSVESFPADSEDPPPSRSTSTTRVIRKEKAEKNKRTNLSKKTRFCNSRMVVAIVLSVFITALFSLPAGFVAGWFGHEAYKN